jgi:hypothetical protein
MKRIFALMNQSTVERGELPLRIGSGKTGGRLREGSQAPARSPPVSSVPQSVMID